VFLLEHGVLEWPRAPRASGVVLAFILVFVFIDLILSVTASYQLSVVPLGENDLSGAFFDDARRPRGQLHILTYNHKIW
jgi:hypothetical protein